MTIKRYPIFILIFLLVFLADVSILLNVEALFIRPVLTGIAVLFIPGLLINLISKPSERSRFEILLFSVAWSVALAIFTGLGTNTLLSAFNIPNPLSLLYLFIGFNSIISLLFVAALYRSKEVSFTIYKPDRYSYKSIFYIVPILFPFLSILGANLLNNHGSNLVTLFMLGIAAVYIGIITFLHKRVNDAIYPFTLFMIALALLLMLSFRSFYISGFDNSMEFEVFKITEEKMHWAMSNFNNVYNACLSITILPTYLNILIHIQDEYIYKFFFQVIFSLTPIGIYLLAKKLKFDSVIAFLAGVFYISNPWFIDPMTTLNRQEIAFFFFICVLLLLFDRTLHKFKKYIYLCSFTLAMVMSHYSTSYITILLFGLAYGLSLFLNLIRLIKPFKKLIATKINFNIKIAYLIFLIAATFTWFSAINHSSENLSDVIRTSIANLPQILNNNLKSAIIDQIFNTGSTKIDSSTYQKQYQTVTAQYKQKKYVATYDFSAYRNFAMTPIAYPTLPIANRFIFSATNIIYKLSLIGVQIFLIVGSIYVILFYKKHKKDASYVIIFLICEFLLFLMTVLPYISIGYNFDRLYMQVMFLVSMGEVYGGLILARFILRKHDWAVKALSLFYIVIFLFTFGFIWQIVGGKPVMWLNNFGYFYDETYTHESEYRAATWMGNLGGNPLIYTTPTGRNILWAYAKKNNVNNDVFPSSIDKGAYVFATYSNTVEGVASFYYRGIHLGYVYPTAFLNDNKNKVYSNGRSEIFK